MGIGGVIRDHSGTILRASSKHVEMELAIRTEILELLEGLMQAKVISLSNLIVEGDSATVISWVNNKERDLWKFDNWMREIIDTTNELGYSLSWIPCTTNQVTNQLAKQGAKHMASSIGNFLPH